MAETANISTMGELVFNRIFNFFGWKRIGPTNKNFVCLSRDAHKNITHPTDIVFHSTNPYTGQENYLNVDLKSYSAKSITRIAIVEAINNLAKAVECAKISEDWKKNYTLQTSNVEISGLLFIYNHDATFDHDLDSLLAKITEDELFIPKGVCIYVMGPKQIAYLLTVVNSIRINKSIPEDYKFYYPNLILTKAASVWHDSASLETLVGPFQVLSYRSQIEISQKRPAIIDNHILFYNGSGTIGEEFKYLMDFLFRFQIVGRGQVVTISMPTNGKSEIALFENAKQEYFQYYFRGFDDRPEIVAEKGNISFREINEIQLKFSADNIGMKDRSQHV